MDSTTQQSQTNSTQQTSNALFTPFNSYNQELYQYNRYEQTTYSFAGPFIRTVSIPTIPPYNLNLNNQERVFFIARVPLVITKVQVCYQNADSAAYLVVEKLAQGVAPGSGFPMLPDPFDCTLAANTTQIRNIDDFVLSIEDRALDQGDRLGIWFPVVPDTLANLTITVEYKY
jgi:hypothetical protein